MAEKTVIQNGLLYTLSDDGSYYTVEVPSELGEDVIIENSINGIPVVYDTIIDEELTTVGATSEWGSAEEPEGYEEVYRENGIAYYQSPDGSHCLVNWDKATEVTDVTILSEVNGVPVTIIYDYAFQHCSKLTSIIIPDSVTSIGCDSFYDCSKLTSIIIPDSVTSIGREAFYYCGALTSVTIGNSVTSIGKSAFNGCSFTSINIPDSVTSIGDYAFFGCSKLTSITIPDGVTSIGDEAFRSCGGLTSIIVDPDNTVYKSDGNCLIEKATNKLIKGCNTSIIPNDVSSIGSYAFNGCSSLTSITIPDSATSIGQDAFYGCSKLTSVTIGNGVTSIGDNAFTHCSRLASITIPNSVTSIGTHAFSSCWALTSIAIPDSVTSIGMYTFQYCSALTSVTIGNGVTSIGRYAFEKCSALKTVILGKGLKTLDGTAIYNGSFYNCTSLTTVINKSDNLVTPDNTFPFNGCSNLTKVYYTSTTAGYVEGGTWCGRTLEYLDWNGEDSLMLNATVSNIILPTDSEGKTSATAKTLTSV